MTISPRNIDLKAPPLASQTGQECHELKLAQPNGDSHAAAFSSLNLDSGHLLSIKKASSRPDASPLSSTKAGAEAAVHAEPVMVSASRPQTLKSPKAIFRRLTTKLRFPTSPTLPISKPPQPVNSFASPSNRENALRERGLLPPLQPNPDLSAQEQLQDIRYSVVVPIEDVEGTGHITAATRVKQEWEARNRMSEDGFDEADIVRSRLRSFKFGGSSSSLPLILSEVDEPKANISSPQLTPPPPILAVTPVTEASWITPKTPDQTQSPASPARSRTGRPPALDLSQTRRRSFSKPRPSPTGPLPPLPATPENTHSPRSIPLPVSPPSTPRTPSKLREPYLVPLPLSPPPTPANLHRPQTDHTLSHPPSPSSLLPTNRTRNVNAVGPALNLDTTPSLLPSPTSPTFPAARPQLATRSDNNHISEHTVSPIDPLPRGIETSSISNTSIATPSLVTPSQACTSTSMSSSSVSSTSRVPPRIKHAVPDISVILESPVEEKPTSHILQPHTGTVETQGSVLNSEPDAAPSRPSSDRRKSLSIFRRGDNGDATSLKSTSSSLRRKNTLSSSFSNFRKSVLGPLTLTRHKLSDNQRLAPSTFDASHLPPSPTLPTFLNGRAKPDHNDPMLPHCQSAPVLSKSRGLVKVKPTLPSPPQSPRKAIDPTIHSRGSILLETFEIEDEESRRLSEMAFLH